MKTIALASALGLLLTLCLPVAPAEADFLYVSQHGDDANICNIPSPCKTFQGAHNTAPNGSTIICLDSFLYGAVTITKTITIDCRGTNASTYGIIVNAPNGAVVLRGLNIYGSYNILFSPVGVTFTNGQELHIEHSTITGFTNGGSGFAAGINFTAGDGKLFLSDTVVSLNGNATNGGGIIIQPSGSGNRRVVLNRVQVTSNTVGIISVGGSGTTIVEVRDSTVTGNQILGAASHGIFSQSSSGLSAIVIDRSSINLNFGNGIMAQGPGTLIHIGRSDVRGNGGGLIAGGGASILSYGDNHTKGNGNDGGPTGVLAPN
jgi:hypothetical protein